LRIISGDLKGRKLQSVRGMATRPTSDRVREALFNILGAKPHGAQVLDLFAGTGALGIEALSRGASSAVFIDHSAHALSVVRKNLEHCNISASSHVIQWDIAGNLNCLKRLDHPFDLVFLDPPYHKQLVPIALTHLLTRQCLSERSMVVAEHEPGCSMEMAAAGWVLEQERRYGQTMLSFFTPRRSPG
jgi:16S rRNA (guanine966-N2)-methyltransferase